MIYRLLLNCLDGWYRPAVVFTQRFLLFFFFFRFSFSLADAFLPLLLPLLVCHSILFLIMVGYDGKKELRIVSFHFLSSCFFVVVLFVRWLSFSFVICPVYRFSWPLFLPIPITSGRVFFLFLMFLYCFWACFVCIPVLIANLFSLFLYLIKSSFGKAFPRIKPVSISISSFRFFLFLYMFGYYYQQHGSSGRRSSGSTTRWN